jgi:hypothetical protein
MADNPSNGNFTNYGAILAALDSASALFFQSFLMLDMCRSSVEPLVRRRDAPGRTVSNPA